MAYEVEFRYADSILFLDSGAEPEPEFFYADSYMEWQWADTILFGNVIVGGLTTN